jgi:hypothetical protein
MVHQQTVRNLESVHKQAILQSGGFRLAEREANSCVRMQDTPTHILGVKSSAD